MTSSRRKRQTGHPPHFARDGWESSTNLSRADNARILATINPSARDIAAFNAQEVPTRVRRSGFSNGNQDKLADYEDTETQHKSIRLKRKVGGMTCDGKPLTPEQERPHELHYEVTRAWPVPKANSYHLARYGIHNDKLMRFPNPLQQHMFKECPNINIVQELTTAEVMRCLDMCKAEENWPYSEVGETVDEHEGGRYHEYRTGNMVKSPHVDTEFEHNPSPAYNLSKGYFKDLYPNAVPKTPERLDLIRMTMGFLREETEARLAKKNVPQEEWPKDSDYEIRAVMKYMREYETSMFDDFRDFWPAFPHVCKLKPNRYFFSMVEMAHSIHPIWGMFGNDCLINGWNAFPQEFIGIRKPVGWRGYFISDDPRELATSGPFSNESYHKMPVSMFDYVRIPPFSYPSWYWTTYTPEKNIAINLNRTMGNVFAIDIDVPRRGAVEQIIQIIEDTCGMTPFIRVGNYPKLMLLYRLPEGMTVQTKVIRLRDDLGMIEILGNGKTFTAFGIHHSMRTTFQWIGGCNPVENRPEDVPVITDGALSDALTQINEKMGEVELSEGVLSGRISGGGTALPISDLNAYPKDESGLVCDNRSAFVARVRFLGYSRYMKTAQDKTFADWRDNCIDDIMETLRTRMVMDGRWTERYLQRSVQTDLTRMNTRVESGDEALIRKLQGATQFVSKTGEIRSRNDGAAVQKVNRSNDRRMWFLGKSRLIDTPDVSVDDGTPYIPPNATDAQRAAIMDRGVERVMYDTEIRYKISRAVEDNIAAFLSNVYASADHVKEDAYQLGDTAGPIFTNDAPTGSGKTSHMIKAIIADPRTVQDLPWKDKRGQITYKRRPIVIAMPNYGNIKEAVSRARILCMPKGMSDDEIVSELVRLECATDESDARARLPEAREIINRNDRDPNLPPVVIKVYEGRERAGCQFKYELKSLSRAHQPADRMCKTGKDEDDPNYSVCEHYETCNYIRQKREIEEAHIIFMVHAFVSSGGLPECIEQARALIIDEQIYQQFMHHALVTRPDFDISPEIFKIWNVDRADEDKREKYLTHNADMWKKREMLPIRDWAIDAVIDAVKKMEDPAQCALEDKRGFNVSAWRRDNGVQEESSATTSYLGFEDDYPEMEEYYEEDDYADVAENAAPVVISNVSIPIARVRQSLEAKKEKEAEVKAVSPREHYRNYLVDNCAEDESGDEFVTLHEALKKCVDFVSYLFKQDIRVTPGLGNESIKLKLDQPGVINAESERELWNILVKRCEGIVQDRAIKARRDAYADNLMAFIADEDAEELAQADSRMPSRALIESRIEAFNKANPLNINHADPRLQHVTMRKEIDGAIVREEYLRISWRTHPGWEGTPLMLMDASTDIDIVEKIFGPHENGAIGRSVMRKKIIPDAGMALNLDIVVVTDHMYSNNALIGAKDANILQTMKASVNLANARDAISAVCAMHGGSRVVAGAPKKVRQALLTGWMDKPASLDSCHFGAMRGIDAYKKHQASVCLGRMEPPVEIIDAMAACLSYDDVNYEPPFNLHGTGFADAEGSKPLFQPKEERNIRMRSGGVASFMTPMVPGQWGKRVQKQIREEEINQFIGRLRPVYREPHERPICYILSSTIPEHLILSDVVSIYDLTGTDGITNVSHLKKGWNTLNDAPSQVKKERTAKWEFSSLLRIVNRLGGFLNSTEIANGFASELPKDIRTVEGINNTLRKLGFRPDSDSKDVKAGRLGVNPRIDWLPIADGWHGLEIQRFGSDRTETVWLPGYDYKTPAQAHRVVEDRYGAEVVKVLHVASRAECYTRQSDAVEGLALYGIEEESDVPVDVALKIKAAFEALKSIEVKDLIEGRRYQRTAFYRTCWDTETLTSDVPMFGFSKSLLDCIMGIHAGMKPDSLARALDYQDKALPIKMSSEQVMAFLAIKMVWGTDIDSLVLRMEAKSAADNREPDAIPESAMAKVIGESSVAESANAIAA